MKNKLKYYKSPCKFPEVLKKILCFKKKTLYLQSQIGKFFAEIAQLVERNLAKVEVAGPNPVFRSKTKRQSLWLSFLFCGNDAKNSGEQPP